MASCHFPGDTAQQAKTLDTFRAPRDGNRFYGLYELGCRFSAIKDPVKAVEFVPAPLPGAGAAQQPRNGSVGPPAANYPNGAWGQSDEGETFAMPYIPGPR